MKFTDWFENNLKVGRYPDQDFNYEDYDIIINVSDEFKPECMMFAYVNKCHYFWFPMNEKKRDVGLNSIFGACCILHYAESKNMKVYLQCHAGVNRSQAVKSAYHYIRTGKHHENEYGGFINPLLAMSGRGYLPPKAEMEEFLSELSKQLKEGKYRGLEMIKINTIKNF